MAIGGIWLPRDEKHRITAKIQEIRRRTGIRGEVKWSKTSNRCLAAYRQLTDFFFDEPAAKFRVIVVDQAKFDPATHHGGDSELGFYKFYYEMLEKWIEPGNEYLVLLDFKQNHGADRYQTLRLFLERRCRGFAWISDLTVIDSRQAPIAQICDLLTGAVAADSSSDLKPGTAKSELAAHIAGRLGWPSLRCSSLSPAVCKFNVFRIQLQ
jgi:hypothetical protein